MKLIWLKEWNELLYRIALLLTFSYLVIACATTEDNLDVNKFDPEIQVFINDNYCFVMDRDSIDFIYPLGKRPVDKIDFSIEENNMEIENAKDSSNTYRP